MSKLEKISYSQLKKMAEEMNLPFQKSKVDYIKSIEKAFEEYNEYKKNKIDKYKKIKYLGNKGDQGITYLVKNIKRNKYFAMKTFKKNKSSKKLKLEYDLQKRAAAVMIAPRVVEYDSVSKYIIMEKMDYHLYDVMKKNRCLTKKQQLRILEIFEKLDNIGIFHGDSNILNYMIKNNVIYIIDFGLSKEITNRVANKLGTNTPNMKYMTLGLILKLRERKFPPSSWKFLKKFTSQEDRLTFKIE